MTQWRWYVISLAVPYHPTTTIRYGIGLISFLDTARDQDGLMITTYRRGLTSRIFH